MSKNTGRGETKGAPASPVAMHSDDNDDSGGADDERECCHADLQNTKAPCRTGAAVAAVEEQYYINKHELTTLSIIGGRMLYPAKTFLDKVRKKSHGKYSGLIDGTRRTDEEKWKTNTIPSDLLATSSAISYHITVLYYTILPNRTSRHHVEQTKLGDSPAFQKRWWK